MPARGRCCSAVCWLLASWWLLGARPLARAAAGPVAGAGVALLGLVPSLRAAAPARPVIGAAARRAESGTADSGAGGSSASPVLVTEPQSAIAALRVSDRTGGSWQIPRGRETGKVCGYGTRHVLRSYLIHLRRYDEVNSRLEAIGARTPPGRLYHFALEAGGMIQVGGDPGEPRVLPIHNSIAG